ncbi:hypothetical protein EV126DRAFT_204338 [Verticillium dahliae]|nr:hypothetical protein EV126DRAFT_204338 [Verticillium dahliae]
MSRSARSHTTRGRSGSVEASAESGRERHPADFKFNWTPVILVGLISTTMWGPFNRTLDKCNKRHEEEDRIEEQRRQEQEERMRRVERRRARAQSMYDFEESQSDPYQRPERRQGGRMAGEEDGNRRRRGRSAVGGRLQSAVRAGAVEQPQPRWAADERYGRVYEYEVIEAPEVDRRRTQSRRRDRSW